MEKTIPRPQHHSTRGFTLIELMIVVAIVAILVAVAIVAYTRHIKSARVVDGRAFLSTIQSRQEAYFQRFGYYCNTTGGAYPTLQADEPVAKQWAPGTNTGWPELGASPRGGMTYFAYTVVAGVPTMSGNVMKYDMSGCTICTNLQIPAQPGGAISDHPWYYAYGQADLNGDKGGNCTTAVPPAAGNGCTILWTTSARNDIVTIDEGE